MTRTPYLSGVQYDMGRVQYDMHVMVGKLVLLLVIVNYWLVQYDPDVMVRHAPTNRHTIPPQCAAAPPLSLAV